MWVMTTGGFVSAVQEKDDPTSVSVRARDRASLQCVLDGAEMLAGHEAPEIRIGEGTDYPYRVTIPKKDFATWLAFEAVEYVNYDNFKDAVTTTRGKRWHDALLSVWVAMFAVTDDEGKSHGLYGWQPDDSKRAGRWASDGAWGSRYPDEWDRHDWPEEDPNWLEADPFGDDGDEEEEEDTK